MTNTTVRKSGFHCITKCVGLIGSQWPKPRISTYSVSITVCSLRIHVFLVGPGIFELLEPAVRVMYYSVMTQANSEKEIPSAPIRSRTEDLPITSSDALPLSYRRLVGAKAIKLGLWDKHPAYCWDWNVSRLYSRTSMFKDFF